MDQLTHCLASVGPTGLSTRDAGQSKPTPSCGPSPMPGVTASLLRSHGIDIVAT